MAPAVFFDGDMSNPDTIDKFWADLQKYGSTMVNPDAQGPLSLFRSDRVAQKANWWASGNRLRYQNTEFDALHDALRMELDPVWRAALTIRLNDLVVSDGRVIPLFKRKRMVGVANKLEPVLSACEALSARRAGLCETCRASPPAAWRRPPQPNDASSSSIRRPTWATASWMGWGDFMSMPASCISSSGLRVPPAASTSSQRRTAGWPSFWITSDIAVDATRPTE